MLFFFVVLILTFFLKKKADGAIPNKLKTPNIV